MRNILIVDDSAVVRKIARRVLEGMNFRADEASNGSEALAACELSMPDAILVDASMPSIDGYEFVKRLRLMPGGRFAKVVFCASENNVSQIAKATHAGANDFMLKPFDRELLASKFAEVEPR